MNFQGFTPQGVVIVSSCGNTRIGPHFPSSYRSVLSVGAYDENGNHWEMSNIWHTVNITAPGANIISAYPPEEEKSVYCINHGTSISVPHVTGILALGISFLKKKFREEYRPTQATLVKALKESAIDVSEEQPYHNDTLRLLRRYQKEFDPDGIFIKASPRFIRYLYGAGLVRAFDFISCLDSIAKP